MKRKSIVMIAALLAVSFTLSGCVANPRQQLLEGLSGLLMSPVKEATGYNGYPDGVAGDMQELMQTQSHEMSMKAKIKEMDLGQAAQLPMGIELTGAYLSVDSAYDMKTGDMAVDLGVGMGAGDLANVSMFLKGDEFALDAGELLPNMYVVAFDSALDFKNPVSLQKRMSDLAGSDAKDNKELIDEFQGILDDYIAFTSGNLDKKWVTLDSDTIDVFGESQKCNTITLSIEGEDLQNLLTLILEKAKDDEALAAFVLDNFMTGVDDAEDQYDDAIDEALDSIDGMDDDEVEEMALEVTVYYVKNAPVALEMAYEDSVSDSDLYWKYIAKGLEKDIEFSASENGEDLAQITYLNVLNKDVYEFEFEMSADTMSISGDGEQKLEKGTETVDVNMDISVDDGTQTINLTETANMSWEAVKAGSEYSVDGSLSMSGGDGTNDISASFDISGDMTFSQSVEVDVPEWDSDAVEVDSFEELVTEIATYAFGAFGGLSDFTSFT